MRRLDCDRVESEREGVRPGCASESGLRIPFPARPVVARFQRRYSPPGGTTVSSKYLSGIDRLSSRMALLTSDNGRTGMLGTTDLATESCVTGSRVSFNRSVTT